MRHTKVIPAAVPRENDLLKRLKSPEFAVLYLNATLKSCDDFGESEKTRLNRFLKALRSVARAQGLKIQG